MLYCLDLATGKLHYGPERLRVGHLQLVAAAGRRQALRDERGRVTSVVKAGTAFELLAENALDGFTVSSPAAASGQLFIRTSSHLYAIGAPAAR